jgi:general secretion pathway protein C
MDFASRLAEWRDHRPEQWFRAANRVLPPGVTAVLVIAIAYQCAALTWRVMPVASTERSFVRPVIPNSAPAVRERSIDFTVLKESHFFGEARVASDETVVDAVDAPDTTLGLTLSGSTAVLRGELPSQATIASGREQKTYRIGQAIDGANGATLSAVYQDRVMLNRGGRLETLRLPQELSNEPAARVPPQPIRDRTTVSSDSLQQAITQNASRLMEAIRFTAHVEQGQLVGFRLSPNRDRETFEALGLQPGDIVTDINGTPVDDSSRGLFESLGDATIANVVVLRNGVPQLIVIDASQLDGRPANGD